MHSDMNDEVMATFREEALDLVQRVLAVLNRVSQLAPGERGKPMQEVDRLLHTLKGAAAAVGNESIKERAHALEDHLSQLPKDARDAAFAPLFSQLEEVERLCSALGSAQPQPPTPVVHNVSSPQPAAIPSAPLQDVERPSYAEWLRIPPERIDQLHAHLGELTLTRLQNDELVERMLQLRVSASRNMARQRELGRLLAELRPQLSPESHRKLRVSAQALGQGWGEFLETLQGSCRDARVLQAQSSVVSQGVEESIRDLRLMPLAPFFEGFARAAREAARHTRKEVRYHVRAEGAEVDRTVLTRLSDALLHLVRNAVVHGIEEPSARARAGKPSDGNLTLEAWSAGTHAVIRISDDGAGVDVDRVHEKARKLGITLGDGLLDVLTHPGFSTRDAADELAGRGVGLDVVSSIVRGLDGTLELSSEPGRGSVFTIRVPIAASTAMGLVLSVGSQQFGVMLSGVERVLRPLLSEIQEVEGRPAVRVGDEMVALLPLAQLLDLPDDPPDQVRVPVLVLQQARRRLAIMVRDIPSEQALVVRPFGRSFRSMELFVGGAVQPDHSVLPVLSTAALFARALRTSRATIPRGQPAVKAPGHSQLHALVVDDSITMRTLLRNVLTAAGYQVRVADDGDAALAVLAEMPECQILITDLQMPRMDGIELCRQVRARKAAYLPIIMVTSVDDDGEKSRALSAGADAYVVKSTFDQTSFLHRVDSLVRGPS